MMKEWKMSNLGRIADIKRGLPSQDLYYVDSVQEGVRLIRINDFKSDTPKYIKETEKTQKLTIKKGDILMAGTGATAGISFLVDDLWDGLPYSYNAPRIRVKDGNSSDYVYYILNSERIKRQQNKLFTGNAQPFLDTRAIASFKIPIPPLPEQQKIAEILSVVDEKIEIINQQILETQQLKKGMMQRLLTKGIAHTELKDSPLGEIPRSWEVVTVREITKEHKQGYYTKDDYTNEGIKLARITDLNNPKVDYTDMPFLNITKSDFTNYKIEKGDFLFARSGAIGRYGIVENEEYPAIFASYLIRFRFNNDIVNRFFGYFFESNMCSRQLSSITQGNANVNINAENIKSLKFPFAPYSEQQKIAIILTTIDDKLEVLADKKAEYKELKKGLMQQLLTGKVRMKLD